MSTSRSSRADPGTAASIATRLRPATGVALATAGLVLAMAILVVADVLWWGSSRLSLEQPRCVGGHTGSPLAVGLAVAGAALVVASLSALLVDWVRQSVTGDRRLGRGRALSVVMAVLLLLGGVISIGLMCFGTAFSPCA